MVMPSQARPAGLSQFLNAPGGVSARDLIAKAEENVQAMRGEVEADMDEAIGAIVGVIESAAAGGEALPLAHQALLREANRITSVAGLLGEEGLARAAQFLVDVAADLEARDAWDENIVRLHYFALRRLRAGDAGPIASLLEGLARLRRVVRAAERRPASGAASA